jgi:predicted transcriptional regulator
VSSSAAPRKFLTVDPEHDIEVVRGLASPIRLQVLHVLRRRGPMNVNEIARHLGLPQSTIATNVQTLEAAGLIRTELTKAAKANRRSARCALTRSSSAWTARRPSSRTI